MNFHLDRPRRNEDAAASDANPFPRSKFPPPSWNTNTDRSNLPLRSLSRLEAFPNKTVLLLAEKTPPVSSQRIPDVKRKCDDPHP